MVVALAGGLLLLSFVRGVEIVGCMTAKGHEARIECLELGQVFGSKWFTTDDGMKRVRTA